VRIGMIGLGRIGHLHAANLTALARDPARPGGSVVEEVLLHSPEPGQADAVAAELGAPTRAVDTVDELMAQVDGVVVAAPTPYHPELIRRAVDAGIPTLCEKPAAMELDVLQALCDDVELAGVPVMIGFQRRYDHAYQRMAAAVHGGALGTVFTLRAVAHDRVPPPPEFVPTSGGVWRDLLVHEFDAMHWITGQRVTEVYASGSVFLDPVYERCGDADTAAVTLRFADGALGVVTGQRANGQGYDCRLEVHGERGSRSTGLDPRTPLASLERDGPNPAAPYQGFDERFAAAYRSEVEHFCRVVRGAAANLSPPRAGVHSAQIALACARSFAQHRPVTVDEAGNVS
jgi:myo-inositol 2-dehydrogenase / D-chiro-inositol 1-dehydrogenase